MGRGDVFEGTAVDPYPVKVSGRPATSNAGSAVFGGLGGLAFTAGDQAKEESIGPDRTEVGVFPVSVAVEPVLRPGVRLVG
jgi:hypothetical protein